MISDPSITYPNGIYLGFSDGKARRVLKAYKGNSEGKAELWYEYAGGSEWRPITDDDFTYTGEYVFTPFGEIYITTSGVLRFNAPASIDMCIVGGGGGGGRSSAQTSTSRRAQSGGGGGSGGILNVFNEPVGNDYDIQITVAAAANQRVDGNDSIVVNNNRYFYAYGGKKGVDGNTSSKKCGDGGNCGNILSAYSDAPSLGGSGGSGGSYGQNQAAQAGGSEGSDGLNGTTYSASLGTPGTGGSGSGINCRCFTEPWNTLFGSGGAGGGGTVNRTGDNGANYRGNGGSGGSTTYNYTSTKDGGKGGSGVVAIRFHCDPRLERPETPVSLLGGFNLFSEE